MASLGGDLEKVPYQSHVTYNKHFGLLDRHKGHLQKVRLLATWSAKDDNEEDEDDGLTLSYAQCKPEL
jgi:hypothetical protein